MLAYPVRYRWVRCCIPWFDSANLLSKFRDGIDKVKSERSSFVASVFWQFRVEQLKEILSASILEVFRRIVRIHNYSCHVINHLR